MKRAADALPSVAGTTPSMGPVQGDGGNRDGRNGRELGLGLEVVLVPEAMFDRCRQRCGGMGDIRDQVAVCRSQADAARRTDGGHDARGTAAPVIAGQYGLGHVERVHQGDHVFADSGLLPGARRGVGKDARGAMPAQMRHDDTAATRCQDRCHVDIAVDVVGKAVQQDHRPPLFRPDFVIADIEVVRADLTDPHARQRFA